METSECDGDRRWQNTLVASTASRRYRAIGSLRQTAARDGCMMRANCNGTGEQLIFRGRSTCQRTPYLADLMGFPLPIVQCSKISQGDSLILLTSTDSTANQKYAFAGVSTMGVEGYPATSRSNGVLDTAANCPGAPWETLVGCYGVGSR